jgi:hypothetical protein
MAREMRIAIGCAAVALVTCCAGSTYQVVPTGHGTFVIPSQGLMGVSSAEKSEAFEDAAAYCMKLGKEVEPVLTSETEGGFDGLAAPKIEFRCVASHTAPSPDSR